WFLSSFVSYLLPRWSTGSSHAEPSTRVDRTHRRLAGSSHRRGRGGFMFGYKRFVLLFFVVSALMAAGSASFDTGVAYAGNGKVVTTSTLDADEQATVGTQVLNWSDPGYVSDADALQYGSTQAARYGMWEAAEAGGIEAPIASAGAIP